MRRVHVRGALQGPKTTASSYLAIAALSASVSVLKVDGVCVQYIKLGNIALPNSRQSRCIRIKNDSSECAQGVRIVAHPNQKTHK